MISGEIPTLSSAENAIDYVSQYPTMFDYVRKLIGLPKSFGLHACGKIIATKDLDYFLPSCYDSEGIRYLQGDMHDVEDVGLVKIDVLGLRTLDQEYDTLEMSNEDISFIDPRQDFTDEATLDVFRNGDTVGIFQMSSYGMKATLNKMDVRGIEDLSIANALYRPGAMQYIDMFCNRRQGKETVEYLHPDLEPILRNTYGILVFQEQLIEIGRMAGIHNPDLLRKATGKKDVNLLNKVKPELHDNLIDRGWTEEQFNKLWCDMLEFAKYSFNKSHSSAYAIIAYMTAKEKAHYPTEFFAGLCNSYIGKSSFVKDNAEEIVSDMYSHKVIFQPFDFRRDHRRCSCLDGRVIYGIPLIKDCNNNVAEALYDIKDNSYNYFWEILKDLNQKDITKKQIEILILLNFFSDFGNSKQLLRVKDIFEFFKCGESKKVSKSKIDEASPLGKIVKKYSTDRTKNGAEAKSFTLLDINSIFNECEDYIKSLDISDFSLKERMATQKEYLGFFPMIVGETEDRRKLFVNKVYPLKRKKDGKQFGYSIISTSVGSGKQSRFTVFNRLFLSDPINEGDIIYCERWERNGSYFTLTGYSKL